MLDLLKAYKMYFYFFAAAAVAGLFVWYSLFLYNAGKNAILADQAELLKEKDRKIVKLQQELEDETGKVRIVYRNRIQTIRGAVDPSGCADSPVTPDILQQLEP